MSETEKWGVRTSNFYDSRTNEQFQHIPSTPWESLTATHPASRPVMVLYSSSLEENKNRSSPPE